jgi:predicted transcriptional regulator
MKAGAAASNPNKLRILNVLMKRELSVKAISKSVRMPEIAVTSLINELVKDGFVEESEGVFRITEEGKKALRDLR